VSFCSHFSLPVRFSFSVSAHRMSHYGHHTPQPRQTLSSLFHLDGYHEPHGGGPMISTTNATVIEPLFHKLFLGLGYLPPCGYRHRLSTGNTSCGRSTVNLLSWVGGVFRMLTRWGHKTLIIAALDKHDATTPLDWLQFYVGSIPA